MGFDPSAIQSCYTLHDKTEPIQEYTGLYMTMQTIQNCRGLKETIKDFIGLDNTKEDYTGL